MRLKLWLMSGAALIALMTAGTYFIVVPWLLAQLEPQELPIVVVEASYPGASAQVVADTVAAPIEQQVYGVEDLMYLRSQSRSDGTYTLTVAFRPGTDMRIAELLVQNRVTLAQPVLPAEVIRHGISVRKKSPHALLLVALTSPDGRYDDIFLNNYAVINLKDEFIRTQGVGDVHLAGQRDTSLSIHLDSEKLSAQNLTAADVAKALRDANLSAKVGAKDDAIAISGGILSLEEIADIVLKTDGEGRVVRLRDVARPDQGPGTAAEGLAKLDGKPAVILAIYPTPKASPREFVAAVQEKVARLRETLPDGLAFDVAMDFTTHPECLRIDLELPASATLGRTTKAANRCAELAGKIDGVANTLTLCGPPFVHVDNQACVMVRLASAKGRIGRDEIAKAIREALTAELPDATARLCDVSTAKGFTTAGYPIDLAIHNLDDDDNAQKLAEKLAERLRQSAKLTDVWLSTGAGPEQVSICIDRTKALALAVSTQDVFKTLQVYFGASHVNDFKSHGRTWEVKVQGAAAVPRSIDDLKKLQVRNANGQMVALAAFVELRREKGIALVERFDFYRIVRITANPAVGVPLAQARAFCEEQFQGARKELGLPEKWRVVEVK